MSIAMPSIDVGTDEAQATWNVTDDAQSGVPSELARTTPVLPPLRP